MSDWYPGAQKVPGDASKRRSGRNPVKGAVLHSAEGYAAGLRAELANPKRTAQWHASILKDGTIWQHHPFTVRLNHAADTYGNDNLVGIEHEGVAGELLTTAQLKSSVALVRWLSAQYGFPLVRSGVAKSLYEHREISDTGTACPSGRIPWPEYLKPAIPEPTFKKTDWVKVFNQQPKYVRSENVGGRRKHVYEITVDGGKA